jgi:hypothetical protein
MTNESDVKNREAHEKNKHDTIQELVQNSKLRELHFVVHSLLFFFLKQASRCAREIF